MVNLQAIRRALAAQIQDVIDQPKINVYAYMPDAPRVPCIAVVPSPTQYVNYYATMGPNGDSDVLLELRVGMDGRAEDAQMWLDELLSVGTGTSLPDAVMSDRTLGGVVGDCVALTAEFIAKGEDNAGVFEVAIPIRIIASKGTP